MFKISHNVGHALTTKGKQSPDGVKEWTQASAICKLVIAELANYEGVAQKRFDDTTGQVDIPLNKRYQAVNDWGAHVHIDYHLNAHGDGTQWTEGNGVEVFIAESKPKEALALAQKLQNNLVASTGFRNRGVKFENWAMVYYTKMTSVLIEMGFMTNRQNTNFIRSAEGQKKIALAIVKSLVEQYGLKKVYVPVKIISFYTGGYGGENLVKIHGFITANKYWFNPSRAEDGSMMFTIGGFGEGTADAQKMESFLKENKFWYEVK